MRNPKLDARAAKIDRAMRLCWESLESHLYWTHKVSKTLGKKWEKKHVQGYAELMKILSELY